METPEIEKVEKFGKLYLHRGVRLSDSQGGFSGITFRGK